MGKVIITINRESGSGGRKIAKRLGEILGIKVYDKATLEGSKTYKPEDKKITSREMYFAETQKMRDIASKESCIFVGRTGFRVFKDDKNVFKIFIFADREERVKRVAEHFGIDEKEAAERMDDTENARETYTKYFASASRYDARNYDLTIDVSGLTTDEAAQILAQNIRLRILV
jgi:cytidylate kinase